MLKDEKNIDFYTTGREPSEQEFAQISQWIKEDKEKKGSATSALLRKKKVPVTKNISGGAGKVKQQQL